MTEVTHGYNKVGSFSWKFDKSTNFAELYELNEFDKDYYKPVGLDENERLFRYETDNTKIAKMLPIVKINIITGRVYFLTERGITLDMAHFETRGIRTIGLVIIPSKAFDFYKM